MRISIWFLFFLVQLILSSDCRGQSIEYEELARIPLTDVRNAYIAPYGGIFVISNSKLYKSIDNGKLWDEVNGFPEGFVPGYVSFLADGSAIIGSSVTSIIRDPLIFRDGSWNRLFSKNFSLGRWHLKGNEAYYVKTDSIFRSIDKGRTYDSFKRYSDKGLISYLHVYNEQYFLVSTMSDSSSSTNRFLLEKYDDEFNWISSKVLPEGLGPMSGYYIGFFANQIILHKSYDIELHYSADVGKTFETLDLNGRSLNGRSIFNNYFYFRSRDTLFSLKLGGAHLTENINPVDTISPFESLSFHGKYLLYTGSNHLRIIDRQLGTEIEINDFPFLNSEIIKFKIDKDIIYASTEHVLFQSKDEGNSWVKLFDSRDRRINAWALTEEGSITLGTDDIISNKTNSVAQISQSGVVDYWDLLSNNNEVFSLDNGRYRVVTSNSDCFDVSTHVYISVDNLPFEKYFLNPEHCLSRNMSAVLLNEKIYLFGDKHSDNGIYHIIDVNDNFKIEKIQDVTSSSSSLNYYSIINGGGEIYVYPKSLESWGRGSDSYPVYYSPNISELDIEPVGRAPQGRFMQTDNNDRAFILQSDGTHYVRSDYAIDYDKVEIKNKSFETFIDGDFDSQNRLVIAVEDGRVLRAVTDGITTSTANVEHVDFTLSPNPASEVLHISISDGESSTITISDISGRIVSVSQHQKLKFNIDIAELTNGIYFLSFQNESRSKGTRKFVKM